MSVVMHAWPSAGGVASCCGRPSAELPIGDGRTSDSSRVTCTGDYVPAVWAHDVYPHHDGASPMPLADAARYHLARALAMGPDWEGGDLGPAFRRAVVRYLNEAEIAFHVAALAKDLVGQEALDWVRWHLSDETGELLYDVAAEFDVALDRIKRYETEREHPEAGS